MFESAIVFRLFKLTQVCFCGRLTFPSDGGSLHRVFFQGIDQVFQIVFYGAVFFGTLLTFQHIVFHLAVKSDSKHHWIFAGEEHLFLSEDDFDRWFFDFSHNS